VVAAHVEEVPTSFEDMSGYSKVCKVFGESSKVAGSGCTMLVQKLKRVVIG
jgi:hypothetical protein